MAPDDYSFFKLVGQNENTILPVCELPAKSVKEVRKGVFIYDMGQNMVGVPKIKFCGLSPSTQVTMRYAEVLYPNLPEYAGDAGMMMMENIRAAMAQDIYVAKGVIEVFTPRFTYHGYRYIGNHRFGSSTSIGKCQRNRLEFYQEDFLSASDFR